MFEQGVVTEAGGPLFRIIIFALVYRFEIIISFKNHFVTLIKVYKQYIISCQIVGQLYLLYRIKYHFKLNSVTSY